MARPVDLTELRTFVLLYETRSVTSAAEQLGVTQPSVSYTLAKLRRRFDDPLFLRGPDGLTPTGAAGDLYAPLRTALRQLDQAVEAPQRFEPADAEHEFRAMLSELGQLSFLPLLADRFAVLAPRCRLRVEQLDVATAVDALTRGRIDLVVSSVRLPEEVVERRPFMRVGYAGLVAHDHPRITGDRPGAARLRAERLLVVRGTSGHEGPLHLVEQHGLHDRVELELSSFAAAPYVIAEAELVAIVPRHIGEIFAARHPLRVVDLPWPVAPIEVAAYTRRGPGAAQAWLADLVTTTLAAERLA